MAVRYIDNITKHYQKLGYDPYRWFFADDPPSWAPLRKPLNKIKLGMLSTSGAYVAGQRAYHYKDDTSVREIPSDTPVEQLRFSHITESYLVEARRDPDCLVPLTALRQLMGEGVIGPIGTERVVLHGRDIFPTPGPARVDSGCRRHFRVTGRRCRSPRSYVTRLPSNREFDRPSSGSYRHQHAVPGQCAGYHRSWQSAARYVLGLSIGTYERQTF